eukprot:446741-Prymnesium_polylepis.2
MSTRSACRLWYTAHAQTLGGRHQQPALAQKEEAEGRGHGQGGECDSCLLYTSPSPRDAHES